MRSKLLAIVILVIGFLLAVLGLAWAITLSFQGQLAENSVPLFILLIIAIVCILYGGKESIF